MANPFVHVELNTTDLAKAKKWFDKVGGDLDGVIAKLAAADPRVRA